MLPQQHTGQEKDLQVLLDTFCKGHVEEVSSVQANRVGLIFQSCCSRGFSGIPFYCPVAAKPSPMPDRGLYRRSRCRARHCATSRTVPRSVFPDPVLLFTTPDTLDETLRYSGLPYSVPSVV